MIRRLAHSAGVMLLLVVGSANQQATAQAPPAETALLARARSIHDRVITLDTHVDINPVHFTAERNYTQVLDIQVDLPKMRAGALDAAFFVVHVPQGEMSPEGYERAYKAAIERFDAIHRLTREFAPDQIELALSANDVRRISATGKKVALIGVENGYPIGENISRVQEFHARGARYLSLAHNGHNQLSDSSTGERNNIWLNDGLAPLGKQVIAELNRWGIIVDVSHPSKQSMMQTVAISKAPIIASHSAVRALCEHPRNLDDEQLMALKRNGGVIQVAAYPAFVKTRKPDSAERVQAIAALRNVFNLPEPTPADDGRAYQQAWLKLTVQQRADYRSRLTEISAKFPADPPASVKDFVDHIDYAVTLIGIDHVGISSDFNNVDAGVTGWSDASETFNVTLELVRRAYTEEQIEKLWSGNILRVMDRAQQIARDLQPQ